MEYRVVLADAAKADAESLYQWVKLLDCLYSLNRSPNRCPLALEARKSHREIRNLLYGKRSSIYRILFEVDKERHTVWILHIRHGRTRAVTARRLGEARLA